MKKIFTAIIVLIIVLSLFVTSAFAVKPEDKSNKKDSTEQSADQEDEQQEDKKPNEKRDAKALFRESTKALIEQIHANREEWGKLGDDQDALSDSIEAKTAAIKENGMALDEASLALIKEKMAEVKGLKAQSKELKGQIHALWKKYIEAKKISDTQAAVSVLESLISKQESRIQLRIQLIGVLGEINDALDNAGVVASAEPEEDREDD